MPPRISAALIKRRGVEALTLPQLNSLYENRAEIDKILEQFEELRQVVLTTEKAAQEIIVEAERRQNDLAGQDAALETRIADLDAVQVRRMDEVTRDRARLDEDRRQHDAAVEAHRLYATAVAQERTRKAIALDEREAVLDRDSDVLNNRRTDLDERNQQVEQDIVDLSQDRRALDSRQARIGAGIDRMREALEPAEESGS